MAVKKISEIMESIRGRLGEDTSDETLAIIEDINDTFSDLEKKSKDNTDWEEKYKANDEEWRKKYRDRFFSGATDDPEDFEEPEPKNDVKTFDDLFKEE